jgi:hypothetical protein
MVVRRGRVDRLSPDIPIKRKEEEEEEKKKKNA